MGEFDAFAAGEIGHRSQEARMQEPTARAYLVVKCGMRARGHT